MTELADARRLRQLLMGLALILTFEGIVRKAAPPGFGVPLFLLKDAMVTVMAYFVLRMPAAPAISFLWSGYKLLAFLFIPPILVTMWHDPFLAIFGAKQYLLFPIVAFATFHAFQYSRMEEVVRFFSTLALLIIPTSLVAFWELHLPHDHWLNRTVTGESLEAFQAAGELRVSSTFSFVAQYCIFLNAQVFIFIIALYGWARRSILWKILLASLFPLLTLGSFITGSRGAVTVNFAIIMVATMLTLLKFKIRNVLWITVIVGGLYTAVLAVSYFSPDSTAAYSERENGRMIGVSDEIANRIYTSFFLLSHDRFLWTPFGNGLGIMSNGSDTFSTYAEVWRNRSPWTETDFATTLFEGGYYLVFVWYGFRIYVILSVVRRFLTGVNDATTITGAFVTAFVVITGAFGTLAIQPPMAIWWWLGVGTSLTFWWKCVGPPDSELPKDTGGSMPMGPMRKPRGRSLYAETIHGRK